ncbi:MAG: tripartite tricarboxylate transporter substrate binding protein [Pseudolabrys sp.]|nr:tripartite tricarboxylate transporter substrate binding protein [Pseudolabrys sp.]
MRRKFLKAGVCVALLGLVALSSPARAQPVEDPSKYPSKPVRVIVPFAPGGATDLAMRMFQNGMSQALGQQVVIDNRGGAAGNIGMEMAARATPDGYTLFFGNVGTTAINPAFYKDLAVQPERDFIPVTLASETAGILVASSKFPPNNIKEMIEYVKARPGKINYGAAGISTLNALEMEAFRRKAGLDMQQVPYKGGAGPALNDLAAGVTDVMFVTFSAAIGHVKSGRLKGLAVTTKDRLEQLPEVPTMVEQGFPDSVSSSWQGLFAIAGTPQPIVDKLYAAVVEALKDPKTRDLMTGAGMLASTSASPAAFKAFVSAESAKWKGVVSELGVKLE